MDFKHNTMMFHSFIGGFVFVDVEPNSMGMIYINIPDFGHHFGPQDGPRRGVHQDMPRPSVWEPRNRPLGSFFLI